METRNYIGKRATNVYLKRGVTKKTGELVREDEIERNPIWLTWYWLRRQRPWIPSLSFFVGAAALQFSNAPPLSRGEQIGLYLSLGFFFAIPPLAALARRRGVFP